MSKILPLFAILFLFQNCIFQKEISNGLESELLQIKPLSENVFVHISYLETNDFGKVACNGMIFFDKKEAIVFDTPVDDEASKKLINWIEKEQKKKIKAVVVTHFHNDCLGGLQEFHDSNIKSYANQKTIQLVKQNQETVFPQNGFKDQMELQIGQQDVLVKFFGEGHTKDNVIAYIPSEKAMFGGCLLKTLNAGKGYLGDANVAEWSNTVQKIKAEIPNLDIVVPGHGKSGGSELLDYTIQLFEEY